MYYVVVVAVCVPVVGKAKGCRCRLHAELLRTSSSSSSAPKVHDLRKGKKVKTGIAGVLIRDGHLGRHDSYLCQMCSRYAENVLLGQKKQAELHADRAVFFEGTLKAVESNILSIEQMEQLARALGQSQLLALRNAAIRDELCITPSPHYNLMII